VKDGLSMRPHSQQAGPKIPSSLNVRKKVAISSLLYSLSGGHTNGGQLPMKGKVGDSRAAESL
jgi:hypothetical protein